MSKRLNMNDAFFLQVERQETPMHIGGVHRFRLPEGEDQRFVLRLVQQMRSHAVSTPPFNLRLVEGVLSGVAPAWEEDPEVDLDYHLRHSALPQPGSERELAVLVSRLHSIPMDKSRPLWECHVIEGLADGTFALYVKIHHALMDGMGASKTMQRTMAESPDAKFVPFWASPPKARGGRKKSGKSDTPDNPLSVMLQQLSEQAGTARGLGRAAGRTLKAAVRRDQTALIAPYTAPECITNQPISAQRRFFTHDLDLAQCKALARKAGGTLNDVVLAVCGGAMRRYLDEINELPERDLVACIPVSIRPKDEEGEGNAISMALAAIGTNEPDPRQRFQKVAASMNESKDLLASMSKSALVQYSTLLMAPFTIGQITGIASRTQRPMFNTTISNVPGPTRQLYMGGAELFASYPASLLFSGQALNITLFSYNGKLCIGFTACHSTLPHAQRLAAYTGEAMAELEKAFQ